MNDGAKKGGAEYKGIKDAFASSILTNLPDMVYIKDADLVYVDASQSFAHLVGVQDVSELIGKTDAQLFQDPDLVRRYTDDDHRMLAAGKPLESYIEPFVLDGQRGYCQTSKYPIFGEDEAILGLYGISRDVTREYRAKLNYEQELRALFELPPNALSAALFDITNWRVIDLKIVDDSFHTASNYDSIDAFVKVAVDTVANDEDARGFYSALTRESLCLMFEGGKRHVSLEYQRCLPSGQVHWVCTDLQFILDPVNGNLCAVWILRDIEEQKQAERALTRAAEWDGLTNVYNREATMAHIRRFLSEEGAGETHWLFMIDVDNFKLVNDTFGHQTGDDTLVNIAAAIRSVFRETDIVGRVGGDEFFALMKHAPEHRTAMKKARDLVEALQYVCSENSVKVDLSGSVGVSCYAGDGKPLERLYMEADAALYRAKQAGKNRFAFAQAQDMGSLAGGTEAQEPISAIHLRTLLENMDAAMFQTELTDGGELSVTYSSHSLFLKGDQSTVQSGARGENIWSVIVSEDLEPLKEAIRVASTTGGEFDHVCRVRNADRNTEWRHIRGTHLPNEGDGVRRMIHVATDITVQKQVEAELREKDRIIDFAMRNTDVNLWYFDYDKAECQLTQSCQKAHEMLGVETLEEFPGCLVKAGYIREDCIEMLCSAYERVQETGENLEFDAWYRKADGTGWWCERDMISPLPGEDGRVTHGIGIGKNVTAEKELEEKFHTFQTYRSLAEKSTLASVRMNLTTGWCGDYASNGAIVPEMEQAETVDRFLEAVLENVPTHEETDALKNLSRINMLEAFLGGDTSLHFEYRSHFREESPIWVRAVVDMMKNPSTGDVEALFYTFDVDYEKNMNFVVDQLLSTDYEFLGLIDVVTGRLMVYGKNGDLLETARNGEIYESEMERVFHNLIMEEYYEEGIRTMARSHVMKELATKESYTCSFPARECTGTRAGRKQWKFSYLDESKSKILMTRSDITSIYTAERDPLTGLYNREAFYRWTRAVLDANPETQFLIIRFDIDRFKAYNDVCGVQAGDRLLANLGRAARERTWPEPSVFGRLEADHFVALMPAAEFDLGTWHKSQIRFFENSAEEYRITSSVGIYDVTERQMDVSLMCDRALLALRTVKDNYTHKLAWYNESLRDKLMREQALADEMEEALREGQFVVYFQPLVDYNSKSIIGAEALVRWEHPKLGLIPPDDFIPLFEKNGFIIKLDSYVWEKSCRHLRNWVDRGYQPVPVSVNISRCDLYDPELCKRLYELVQRHGLPFSLLKLEITESAYMEDPDQLIGIVKKLRAMGFAVEMDDFGAGYSSLNMLKDVPVDILKLDTRFLSDSENGERATTILSSIIRMALELNLSVIAEGVETMAQAEYLKKLGCFHMQGYYFGRPIPAGQFEEKLAQLVDGHGFGEEPLGAGGTQ